MEINLDNKTKESRIAGLKMYLSMMSLLRAQSAAAGKLLRMPLTTDEWIEKHGKLMTQRVNLPKGQVHPRSKECYLNAYRLWKKGGVRYCEGYVYMASCPIPVMHGWVVNNMGEVLDPSVANDDEAVYYGVAYRDEFVKERWKFLRKHRAIGILPNAYLFRDADEGWLDKGVMP